MENRIYFGPPGTGKTYFIQRKIKDYISIEIPDDLILNSLSSGKEWLVIALTIIQNNNMANNAYISNKLSELNINTSSNISTILTKHATVDSPINIYKEPRIFVPYNNDWYVNMSLFKSLEKDLYNNYISKSSSKRYEFVTFHQSFVYEDFIEGIKPKLSNTSTEVSSNSSSSIDYEIQNGIFKKICTDAINNPTKKYAIFIDEINRGNISEIFGELLSLIESDKRLGQPNELEITLPYSKKPFGVPSNLDIYGTMNSADKSIANIDIALRRRFEFIPMKSNPSVLEEIYICKDIDPKDIDGVNIIKLLECLNTRIELLLDSNYTIGHAYFSNISNFDDIKNIIIYKVIPLLEEYFYNDLEKVQIILNDLDENGDLDENAIYLHKEIDASNTLRYFGDYDIYNKRIYFTKNIEDIIKESVLKIYEY